jgi:predicted NAD-dependent protein-ADP-ribosyltransferase YbiA (DUF1768 family)
MSSEIVTRWIGEYDWLSNDYLVDMYYGGHHFPTLSHAFLASKTNDIHVKTRIAHMTLTAINSKQVFDEIGTRPNWHAPTVMRDLLEIKFGTTRIGTPGNQMKLYLRLAATGKKNLVYGNRECDNYWGMCLCDKCMKKPSEESKNMLGHTIMIVRGKIQSAINGWNAIYKNCKCGNKPEDRFVWTEGWNPMMEAWCASCVAQTGADCLKKSTSKLLISYSEVQGMEESKILQLPAPSAINTVAPPKILTPTDPEYWDDMDSCGWDGIGFPYPQASVTHHGGYVYTPKPEPPPREYKTKSFKVKVS